MTNISKLKQYITKFNEQKRFMHLGLIVEFFWKFRKSQSKTFPV